MEAVTENRIKVDERLRHIAFIMDGNGRWAVSRGLPREEGHKVGAEALRRITRYCADIGIKYGTVYAFSTENWSRPIKEVTAIMKLLTDYIEECIRDADKNKMRVIFVGSREKLDPVTVRLMDKAEMATEKYAQNCTLNIALNYGGREEIVSAVKAIISEDGKITEDNITAHLYTRESPPPDLIVRTAGEFRLSNFLLWQSSYAEFYATETLWPDMMPEDVDRAIEAFYKRERRYGKV